MAPSLTSWMPSSRGKRRSNSDAAGQLHARWGDTSISAPNGGGWNQYAIDPTISPTSQRSTNAWDQDSINAVINSSPETSPPLDDKSRNTITITIPLPWSKKNRRRSLDGQVPSDITVPAKNTSKPVHNDPEGSNGSRGGDVATSPATYSRSNQASPPFKILSPVTEAFSRSVSQECSPSTETGVIESPMFIISPDLPNHSQTISPAQSLPVVPKASPQIKSVHASPSLVRQPSDRSNAKEAVLSLAENEQKLKRLSRGAISDEARFRRSPSQDRAVGVPTSKETSRRRVSSPHKGSRRAASQQPSRPRAMSREPLARKLSHTSLRRVQFSPTSSTSDSSSTGDDFDDRDSSADEKYSDSRKLWGGPVKPVAGGFYASVIQDYRKIAKDMGNDYTYTSRRSSETQGLEKLLAIKLRVAEPNECVGGQVLVPSTEELWG